MSSDRSLRRGGFRRACARGVALAAVTVWCGSCTAGAFGASKESRLCSVWRCRTLAASARIRVFQTRKRYPLQETNEAVFAEWLPTGRLTELTDGGIFSQVVGPFTIAGHFLAYPQSETTEEPETDETAALVNAKTGHVRTMPATDFRGESPGVVQVALTPAGSLAWMIEGVFTNPARELAEGREIEALSAGAKQPVVLAYSENIVPMSLAATPGHIYWLETSGPRTFAAP